MAVDLLLLGMLAVSLAPFTHEREYEWESWKELHRKQYESKSEELYRHAIWSNNMEYISSHNAQNTNSYKLEMNEFGDLNSSEFTAIYNGYHKVETTAEYIYTSQQSIPKECDWRTKGVVTNIKNQGHCGSCWAFSATGGLEGQHAIKTGKLVSLSEQQLMDCSVPFGNHGCDGGLMRSAFKYIKSNGGLDTEENYPYTAENGTCHYNPKTVGATCSGYVTIPQGDELALSSAVANIGPISAAMDASTRSFQFYKSGVYLDYYCANSALELDHGVLVVGYGTLNDQPYWLVKNSWGTRWGMEGYFMLAKYIGNMCGIATDAAYPLL